MPDIERISGCTPAELWDRYVLPHRPVLLTDLLAGSSRATVQEALDDLAAAELYDDGAQDTPRTVGTWMADLGSRPPRPVDAEHTSRFVDVPTSHLGPATLAFSAGLRTPHDHEFERRHPQGGTLLGFVGAPNSQTALHTDFPVSNSLHYMIAGNKEWFIAPPDACAVFGPVNQGFLVRVMSLPREERVEIARRVGGYSFTMNAGETLFLPAQWAHGVFYVEPSFGVSEPFGRDAYLMFYVRELAPGFLRSAIVARMHPAATVEGRYWQEFLALHDACKQEYAGAAERAGAVRAAARGVYDRLYPERPFSGLPLDFGLLAPLEDKVWLDFMSEQREELFGLWDRLTGLPVFDWWQRAT